MGKSEKRFRPQRDHDGDSKNQRRRVNDRDDNGGDNLIAYRILCPVGVIGSVIGKSGKVINAIRQGTQARVKVVDPFPGANDRVITIYCHVKEKEEVDVDEEFEDHEPLCAAQDALLKVHEAIANAVATAGDSDKKQRDKEECQILVPSSQSANIIGKAGATIKKIRSKTKANIKVTAKDPADPSHSCAMDFDNFVMISGGSEAVKKALFAVSAIMYKFTPKEEVPLDTTVPEAPPSIIIPSEVPVYNPHGLYPGVDSLLPSRSVPSILSTAHAADMHAYADTASGWPVYSSGLPLVSTFDKASRSEELVFKVLCPFDKIGLVIGKGGGTIKSIRQASGARVEVDDTKNRRDECVIIVTATESPDDLKSMAVETVLLLQGKINDDDDDRVTMRLLVSSKSIGCIIGKGGSIINEIRKRTRTDVRISKGNKPKCADSNEELIEVSGEVGNVRDALVQIVLRLRDDALTEIDGAHNPSAGADAPFRGSSGLSGPPLLASGPPVAPLIFDRRVESASDVHMLPSRNAYGYGSSSMGESDYASMSAYPSKLYGGVAPPSMLEIVIPGKAVGKVMGKGGANVANIRKISGANVEISESKSARGDRIALISGTPDQKRTAENLIQAFIMST